MTSNTTPAFQALLDTVERGGDDNWDSFDKGLPPLLKSRKDFAWARNYTLDSGPNENFRDAAATFLAKCDFLLDDVDQAKIIGKVRWEPSEFTRYWLACALYKRGNRHPELVVVFGHALKSDSPAGEYARGLKTAPAR